MQDMDVQGTTPNLSVLWKPSWKAIKGSMKPLEPDQ